MTDLNYESESAKSTSGSLGASTDSNSRVPSSSFKDTIIVSLNEENEKLEFESVEAPNEPEVDFADSDS